MLMVLSHKESEISLLIVEMTDKEVVKQINSDMLVDSPLFDKLHLANCLKRCFKDMELVWVPRQMNKAAEKASTHVKATFWPSKVLDAEIVAINEILDNDKGMLVAYDVDE
ncbi:hypothetical protein LOK49_LG12G02036 [Camellia lanceoleosa]|uniref:Uncharacterized protein n=1 Tax=Camellia lanceoleosa TaxID=1840588 RepID=A0ACC0FTF9_9ERIC|nr:hypothetical protein LOK49_LG12G02036 [Camellia lanceoleosa]